MSIQHCILALPSKQSQHHRKKINKFLRMYMYVSVCTSFLSLDLRIDFIGIVIVAQWKCVFVICHNKNTHTHTHIKKRVHQHRKKDYNGKVWQQQKKNTQKEKKRAIYFGLHIQKLANQYLVSQYIYTTHLMMQFTLQYVILFPFAFNFNVFGLVRNSLSLSQFSSAFFWLPLLRSLTIRSFN